MFKLFNKIYIVKLWQTHYFKEIYQTIIVNKEMITIVGQFLSMNYINKNDKLKQIKNSLRVLSS